LMTTVNRDAGGCRKGPSLGLLRNRTHQRRTCLSPWLSKNQKPADLDATTENRGVGLSGLGEHLTELGGKCVRITGLAVFAAQKAAVIAGEDHRLNTEPVCDGIGASVRHLTR
jgi:hypothetical protein